MMVDIPKTTMKYKKKYKCGKFWQEDRIHIVTKAGVSVIAENTLSHVFQLTSVELEISL